MQGFSNQEQDVIMLLTDANLQRRYAIACWCVAEFAPEAREKLIHEIIGLTALRLDCIPEPWKLFASTAEDTDTVLLPIQLSRLRALVDNYEARIKE
jgi:hypothetical protein